MATIKTTVIGAYPKPDYLPVTDWFNAVDGMNNATPTANYISELSAMGDDAEALFKRAARDVMTDQIEAGVDIITDGEVRRENYVHYHCRHLAGMDFSTLTTKVAREGSYNAALPTVTGPLSARAPFLPQDWQAAQEQTSHPVKMTLPGPMTIADTTADEYYNDPSRLGAALADALNAEVRALAEAGCRYIQIDEPIFARKAPMALEYGIENLARCFHGLPDQVHVTVHICCGYPDRLDNPDYPKAPLRSYFDLADAMDRLGVDAVSIEDAHRPNDLALLDRFQNTSIILGLVAIAKSAVEETDIIERRLRQALDHIDKDRLWAAPDCGLGLLPRGVARQKLTNMCAAVKRIG